jgi:ATP-binding cassette subfamily B protein
MTRVIVAQRILSNKDCDQIAIIDDGKITGLGTHDDLLANSPVYKEIYDAQLGGDFDVQ